MKITISAFNKTRLDEVFSSIMNIASVAAMRGYIPTLKEQIEAAQRGNFWYKSITEENKINLCAGNDYWCFLSERTETSIVLHFKARYKQDFSETMANLLICLFPDNVKKYE